MSAFTMRAFYFSYFAVFGVTIPYLPLYFESLGLTPAQIGILGALVPLARPLAASLWTSSAEKVGRRREAAVLACALTAIAFALYALPSTFAGFAAVTLLLAVVQAPTLAFAEAATLDATQAPGLSYGRVRVWGSAGFIAASWGIGWLLTWWPLPVAVAAATLFAILTAASSLWLPRPVTRPGAARLSLRKFMARPGVLPFYLAATLMQASHGAYYTFFSIHMAAQGRSSATIGSLWALGVVSEMFIMVGSSRFLALAPASRLLTICFVLAALRWGLYAVSASLLVAIPAQVLHAFTYAGFHLAAITATHRVFPPELRSSGQAIYGGLTYGIGSVTGSILAGVLYEPLGAFGLFAVSALVAAAGALIIGRAARRIPGFDVAAAPSPAQV
jgi:PPP family 3-phenylpropionic acid transporter